MWNPHWGHDQSPGGRRSIQEPTRCGKIRCISAALANSTRTGHSRSGSGSGPRVPSGPWRRTSCAALSGESSSTATQSSPFSHSCKGHSCCCRSSHKLRIDKSSGVGCSTTQGLGSSDRTESAFHLGPLLLNGDPDRERDRDGDREREGDRDLDRCLDLDLRLRLRRGSRSCKCL